MVKVMIIEDSALFRDLLRNYLETSLDIEVVATAINPSFAKYKLGKYKPDLVILDIVMPEVNGLDFLSEIMEKFPLPVIVWSSYVENHNEMYLRAIELGALDVIYKPSNNDKSLLDFHLSQLRTRILELSKTILKAKEQKAKLKQDETKQPVNSNRNTSGEQVKEIIAIGGSTGAIQAIRKILNELPKNIPPVLIVQHMPAGFTNSFAANLNSEVKVCVKEAENGEFLKRGCVYIAKGGHHLEALLENGAVSLNYFDGPAVNYSRPSIDVLFFSLAKLKHVKVTGILLSGMGLDGARGLLSIKQAGGKTFIQDKNSCAVFGIPKAALDMGACENETPLTSLSQIIVG